MHNIIHGAHFQNTDTKILCKFSSLLMYLISLMVVQ